MEAAGAAISKAEQSHPDLARMQSDLAQLMQSSQAIVNLRREDLSHRLDRFDIAKFPYVRLTVIQLRSGYEQDFADVLRTIRRAFETEGMNRPGPFSRFIRALPARRHRSSTSDLAQKNLTTHSKPAKREYVNPFDFGAIEATALPKDRDRVPAISTLFRKLEISRSPTMAPLAS